MTEVNNDLEDRIKKQGEANVLGEGKGQDAFSDPSGLYPKTDYHGQSSLNKVARGEGVNELDARNGIPNVNTSASQRVTTQYPMASTNESVSGHIIEINDTPGGERILIKHNTGAGIDIRPDGTIVVNAKSNRVEIVDGDMRMAVEGDGNISYYGNLNMNVSGDYNLTVGGDYNVNVNGNYILEVVQSFKTKVVGIMSEVVQKSKDVRILGQATYTQLGNVHNIIKGKIQQFVQGKADFNYGDAMLTSAEKEISMTTPKMNLGATNMSVVGASGTFGGENIISYAKNMYLGNTLHAKTTTTNASYATTFHGSLNGTAKDSVKSSVSGGIGIVQIPPVNIDNTQNDDTDTHKATAADMSNLLNKTEMGVKDVEIDSKDEIKNFYDKTVTSGGITDRSLNTGEIRSKLKDTSNKTNIEFIGDRMGSGLLSGSSTNTVPGKIGRVRGKQTTARIGQDIIGSEGISLLKNKYKPSDASAKPRSYTFPVEAQFNPENQSFITVNTPLAKGVTISKFTGGVGSKVNLNHITNTNDRKQLARNLYVQAQVIKSFYSIGALKKYNIVVAEGIYVKGPGETTSAFNKLAETGQAVAYEVYSTDGTIALDKLFDFAEILKDTFNYDKLELSYDTYDPSGSLHGQLLVEIPKMPSSFNASFSMNIGTSFNGDVQSNSDLMEILEE